MTTPQFILPFIVQKVEGDEGLAFITDSGGMDTVRCITEEMPLDEAQWLCDRLNASTATASEAARRAAEEIAAPRRDGEPDFRSHTEYAAWAAAIISKHFPTPKAWRAALADAIEEVAKWHERQAFDVESEHPGVQGSKSQKRRKRFHNESAAALRTLPAAQPTGMEDSRAAAVEKALRRLAVKQTIQIVEGGCEMATGFLCELCAAECYPDENLEHKEGCPLFSASRQSAAVPEALSSQQAEGWAAGVEAAAKVCDMAAMAHEIGLDALGPNDARSLTVLERAKLADDLGTRIRALIAAVPEAIPAAQPTGMQGAFEAWMRRENHTIALDANPANDARLPYYNPAVNLAWHAWQAWQARQPAAVPEALSDLQHRLQFARQDAANFKLMTEELVELAGWLGASTPKGHETKVRILAKAKSLLGGITIKGEFPKVGE